MEYEQRGETGLVEKGHERHVVPSPLWHEVYGIRLKTPMGCFLFRFKVLIIPVVFLLQQGR
jgi:hypothetical protein